MKKSAVEWLANNVLSYKNPTNINGTDYILIPINKVQYLKEQAKEMEKDVFEEIIDIVDSENSGLSAEQRLDEIRELIKTFNTKKK